LADRTSRRRSGRERAAPLPAQHADPRNRVRHCRRRRGRPDRLHALARGRAWSRLARLVVGKRGTGPMRTGLIGRLASGGSCPWVTRSETGDLVAIAGPDMLPLRTPVELRGERLTTVGDFAVSAGQRMPFVLTYVPSHLPLPEPVDAETRCGPRKNFGIP